jgi:tight adherence protein B
MKAGHAFAGGMKMLSEEFDDPVGTEFRKTVDEINFGINFNDAMKNLANRIDCPDLQFFVVSVIIQKETGGNLAELLEKIAYLIRERYKLHGKIRAFAAEGKLSAVILSLLPAALAFYFFIVNPKYIGVLFTDRIGIIMALTAIFLMITGVLVIKKMISIRI